jgi:tRNA dimethylallyltransferase
MENIIVIAGATASGKTLVAYELARALGGELISADSRQVYKYLDIGTNKTLFKDVPQHLIDLIGPDDFFDAGSFVGLASEKIKEIRSGKKTPLIVGGTGLYIKALIDGLAPLPGRDEKIRKKLSAELEKYGAEHLYEKLKKIDPGSAETNRKNPQRLIRALEIFELTGEPITTLHKKTVPSKEKFTQIGLRWPRQELYNNIDKRSVRMIESGMIEETQKALKMGFSETSPGLNSLGYRHVLSFLKGEINKTRLAELIAIDTRHYSKRQATWFNRDKRIKWIETCGQTFDPAKIAQSIAKML